MASVAFHGSAIPSPSASTPQRNQVEGMNCIQPTAPAELGPMFWPKFDSILLIEASTCHGIPYAAPACCQSTCRVESGNRWGVAGGDVKETGTEIEPGAFGADALGKDTCWSPGWAPEEMEKPSTGGPAARAEPASNARPIAATTRRRISLRLWRDEAPEPLALAPARALALPRPWSQPRRLPSAASAPVRAC